jgi:hypothetical protein
MYQLRHPDAQIDRAAFSLRAALKVSVGSLLGEISRAEPD